MFCTQKNYMMLRCRHKNCTFHSIILLGQKNTSQEQGKQRWLGSITIISTDTYTTCRLLTTTKNFQHLFILKKINYLLLLQF